jgi:hypothetical protein
LEVVVPDGVLVCLLEVLDGLEPGFEETFLDLVEIFGSFLELTGSDGKEFGSGDGGIERRNEVSSFREVEWE